MEDPFTYTDFLIALSSEVGESFNNQRIGQRAFNILFTYRPELANEIRGTDLDPFFDNDRLPEFTAWLASKLQPDQP